MNCSIVVFLLLPILTIGQNNDSLNKRYYQSYDSLEILLKSNGSFKKAVFITESTFQPILYDNEFLSYIGKMSLIIKRVRANYRTIGYNSSDSNDYLMNKSIFNFLCDSIIIRDQMDNQVLLPYSYNFNDPTGNTDWVNTFVTQMLLAEKGNCRSLAYLYKILADEVGAKCWLALAPNHIYIRNYSRQIGWYNTELTSRTFPTDTWIAASAYVSTDAIRSGIYMDTLSNQQSIALCILDLAKGYEFKTHNYYDGFILKCCDLVLQYHPVNPMALLLKAETLKKVYEKKKEGDSEKASFVYADMEKTYITLAKLHYREMPEKMYKEWLTNLSRHRGQFATPKKQSVPKKAALSSKK